MADTDRPRHFKQNAQFYVVATFDSPLPEGAYPVVYLVGPPGVLPPPSDPGRKETVMLNSGSAGPANMDHPDQRAIRMTGNVPPFAPPGVYKVTKLEMQWTIGSPPSWQPVPIPFDHLGEDNTIIIDPADSPPQPQVPRLADLD